MTENEALNWKTKALIYEMSLSNIKADLEDINTSSIGQLSLDIFNKRLKEANDYLKIWWKKE